ncbi:MAG: glycosyltransferase [bacterium]|nr:glycosyltransferase [bacterium]
MAAEKIDISIVVLNYNTKDFLLKCLQSIKGSDVAGINIEVIVVDNASTDGSMNAIGNLKSQISKQLETRRIWDLGQGITWVLKRQKVNMFCF